MAINNCKHDYKEVTKELKQVFSCYEDFNGTILICSKCQKIFEREE